MIISSQLKEWSIAYSPYVDTLHVYKNFFNSVPKREQISKDFGKFHVIFNSRDADLLLFEMKHASQSFGDIDNMDKEHIIQKVKGCIEHESKGQTRKDHE